jgi:hypothetical protein
MHLLIYPSAMAGLVLLGVLSVRIIRGPGTFDDFDEFMPYQVYNTNA